MRIYGRKNSERVRLFSGDRTLTVLCEISCQKRTIKYELVSEASNSSRRYDRLSKYLPEVYDRLGDAAVQRQGEKRIVISETRACDVGDSDSWPVIFEWIEEKMAYFRSIFTPKAPTALARKQGAEAGHQVSLL